MATQQLASNDKIWRCCDDTTCYMPVASCAMDTTTVRGTYILVVDIFSSTVHTSHWSTHHTLMLLLVSSNDAILFALSSLDDIE